VAQTQADIDSTGRAGSAGDAGESDDAFGANSWLVDEIRARYDRDPAAVDPEWQRFFRAHIDTPAAAAPSTTNGTATHGTATHGTATHGTATHGTATNGTATNRVAAPVSPRPAPASAAAADRAVQPAPPPTTPATPVGAGVRTAPPPTTPAAPAVDDGAHPSVLRGSAARVVENMQASLSVPTATSVRTVPVKLLVDNRTVINRHLARSRGGKVSFTHLIGYAVVRAVHDLPGMNTAFTEVDGKPVAVLHDHVNLGLAIDLPRPDGTRQLMVPRVKDADTLDFAQFWSAYEDLVRRARKGGLGVSDFAGTTISLTNPGTLGTVHSVPRLMSGQSVIVGVGSMDYPAEFQGTSNERISELGVSKVMTLTSTYDHRVIQGALSGEFLRRVHQLLLGADRFYDDIFAVLRIPTEPFRWAQDNAGSAFVRVGKQARIIELIHAYRVRGHLLADTDPLESRARSHPDLQLEEHGLTLWDLDRTFAAGNFGTGEMMRLRDILELLHDSYCRTVGVEYMHIHDPEQRNWIQDKVERLHERTDRDEQLHVLGKLNEAEAFESFLHTKFVGQRRFSLEGGESAIPVLDRICWLAARAELTEVCIGMAHRGRLNVLANIVGKNYDHIFREFEGNIDPSMVQGSGDVKYHLGAEGTFASADGHTIGVSVAANPSHLEAGDPVLEGIVRGKQDALDREGDFSVLPLLVHGDAAFAGQGVVAETLNLSQLRGYRTGGTIHLVINNQVGFTTDPSAGRSSTYSTDVARMIQAPILHVNGDDPEACVRVAGFAFEYRERFHRDVVIDLVCYRKRGHNEGDDPSMTQPRMYDLIEGKRSVRRLYTEALVGRGDITVAEAERAMQDYNERLERHFADSKAAAATAPIEYSRVAQFPDKPPAPAGGPRTAVADEVLEAVAVAHEQVPENFTVHQKVRPQLARRVAMIRDGGIDWATGEALAFGSLLLEGRSVRLAGQDSRRGTFAQRFAVAVDRVTNDTWTPLKSLEPGGPAKFHVYDSLLSEFAAMGFEYGYSVSRPAALTMWEAQFGDFVDGAQTIADEFIAGGEAKWGQHSGVVLLLPHGFEGQGPDHSSARIERWLQLASEGSFMVAQPSTPASYFHLLRQHNLGAAHRPLVVFTPKSLLRSKAAVSARTDFTTGSWKPVLADPGVLDGRIARDAVRRVLLCSGKVAWDLLRVRDTGAAGDPGGVGATAIVRLEQLHPFPAAEIAAALADLPGVSDVRWVQDEPLNQGPWPEVKLFGEAELLDLSALPGPLRAVARDAGPVPAVGVASVHQKEQAELLQRAFAG
jgi:2-oxoglutarate decarboxylase